MLKSEQILFNDLFNCLRLFANESKINNFESTDEAVSCQVLRNIIDNHPELLKNNPSYELSLLISRAPDLTLRELSKFTNIPIGQLLFIKHGILDPDGQEKILINKFFDKDIFELEDISQLELEL